MFPGPSADAWDEACVTLTYRGPSPGQARMGATWKEDIWWLISSRVVKGRHWCLGYFGFWTHSEQTWIYCIYCNLCKLYAAIAARVIGYDVPWCAMKIIINHELQDFFFSNVFLKPVAGHDFPLLPRFCLCHCWASGLEAIHLLGFALGSCLAAAAPSHPETDRKRQKQKHHKCVTFKSLSAVSLMSLICHLLVTCW
jgi:hypothetical protein